MIQCYICKEGNVCWYPKKHYTVGKLQHCSQAYRYSKSDPELRLQRASNRARVFPRLGHWRLCPTSRPHDGWISFPDQVRGIWTPAMPMMSETAGIHSMPLARLTLTTTTTIHRRSFAEILPVNEIYLCNRPTDAFQHWLILSDLASHM